MLISNNDKVFDRGSADYMIIRMNENSQGCHKRIHNWSALTMWKSVLKILWNAGAYPELFFQEGGEGGVPTSGRGGGGSAPPTLNFNKQKKRG